MSTGVIESAAMPRPAYKPEGDKPAPKRTGRVPARLTNEQWDRLREMAVVWHRKPLEVLAGEWLGERIDAEFKAGRKRS